MAMYDTISSLVRTINKADGAGRKLLLKNLLEEAGSSSRSVAMSLSRMLEKGFSQLATKLKRAKTGYENTKALEKKLFGEDYEL
jgi:hypothetical protein